MAREDRRQPTMLEEEACHRKVLHAPSLALTRRRVRNSATIEKQRVGDLLPELLPLVGRPGVDDPSGVVVDQS